MGQNNSRSISNNKRRRSPTKIRELISEKYEISENKANVAVQYLTGECHDDNPSATLEEEYLDKFSYV